MFYCIIYSMCVSGCCQVVIEYFVWCHRCFRLSDLEIGGVIGQGFYGAVTKV